jgi:hypothetical protein
VARKLTSRPSLPRYRLAASLFAMVRKNRTTVNKDALLKVNCKVKVNGKVNSQLNGRVTVKRLIELNNHPQPR